jgi:tRNA(Ile)-lysidine synthase
VKPDAILKSVAAALQPYQSKPLVLALSGGIDSIVLLHILQQLRTQLGCSVRAIHINHQLAAEAADWQQFVTQICDRSNIPLTAKRVEVDQECGDGLEAAARTARYSAIQEELDSEDCLLTAHHADDQIETMLHHLCRGSGLSGLTAMDPVRTLNSNLFIRPLLAVSRTDIEAYAQLHRLDWCEDPSNRDCSLSRNFIRQRLLPELATHYPAVRENLKRSQRLLSETEACLDHYVAKDYAVCVGDEPKQLNLEPLRALPSQVQSLVLRYWFKQNNVRYPTEAMLHIILNEVIVAKADAMPKVEWDQVAVQRYRSTLYILPRQLPNLTDVALNWDLSGPLTLPEALGTLAYDGPVEAGGFIVKFGQKGEQIKPSAQSMTRKLKHLFQEMAIPPWERQLLPMLYNKNHKLVAIPGISTAEFAISWQKGPLFD